MINFGQCQQIEIVRTVDLPELPVNRNRPGQFISEELCQWEMFEV